MNKPVTLEQAAQTFLDRYKPTTRRAYSRDLHYLMQFIAPAVPVESITGYDMERALGGIVGMDSIRSVYTVNKFIKTLRTFFNWCERRNLIDKADPLHLDYRPTPDNDASERTMPEADYQRLVDFYTHLARAKPHYLRALALILVVGDTGTRREGLARLHWLDVDLDEQRIITLEKGDKRHKRYFGLATANVLREWRLAQKVASALAEDEVHVFSRDGQSIKAENLAQFFRRRCREAGIKGYGLHAVRHLVGMRLARNKTPDHIAAQVMGHKIKTYQDFYVSTDDAIIKAATLDVAYKPAGNRPQIREKIRKLNGGPENP